MPAHTAEMDIDSVDTGARKPKRPKAGEMTLEEYVNSLTAADWEGRQLYVSRLGRVEDEKALKAKYNSKYIQILVGPFHEDDPFGAAHLQRVFGGGDFKCTLNWRESKRPDHIERQARYTDIEGEPIYTLREREAGIGVEQEPDNSEQEAAGVEAVEAIERIVDKANERVDAAHEREIEALKSATRPQEIATTGAVEMALQAGNKIADAMALRVAQPPVDTTSNEILKLAVQRMLNPPDPIEMFVKFKQMELAGGNAASSDPFGQLAPLLGFMEKLGIKLPGAAGGDDAQAPGPEPPSIGERALDLLGKAIDQGPLNWVNAWGAFQDMRLKIKEREIGLELRRRQLGGAAPDGSQPAAAAATPEPEQARGGNPLIERLCETIAKSYLRAVPAEDAAQTLLDAFEAELNAVRVQLAPYKNWWANADVVAYLSQAMPSLRIVLTDPGFGQWAEQLWGELDKTAPLQGSENGAGAVAEGGEGA